jgi:TatD DNase family protein
MIDSHCHLDVFAKSGKLEDVIARAKEAGVTRMVTIGTDLSDWKLYSDIAAAHPGVIDWTAGLHPTELSDDWEEKLAALPSYFATKPHPVAIGEVGLDYYHLPKDKEEAARIAIRQKNAFRAQLEIALQLDCPLVVHARKSFADTVEMIDKSGIDWRKVVFHCFSEGAAEIRLLNDKGARGSFTGTVTYKNAANVLEAALAQGPDRLMIETDSPYLSPEPLRGKPCEPAYVAITARFIAEKMQIPPAELCAISHANAARFFGLSDVSL